MVIFFLTVIALIGLFTIGDSYVVYGCLFFSLIVFLVCGTGLFLPLISRKAVGYDYPVVHTVDPMIRWVAVLGAGTMVSNELPVNHLLNIFSIRRLLEGVRLYRQLPPGALLILSGGSIVQEESTATNLGVLASWFGIPDESIVLKKTPLNTISEVLEIKKTVKDEPFYLVTSSDHMPRAMAECIKVGLCPIAAPADSIAINFESTDTWMKFLILPQYFLRFYYVSHEIFGRIWSRLKG